MKYTTLTTQNTRYLNHKWIEQIKYTKEKKGWTKIVTYEYTIIFIKKSTNQNVYRTFVYTTHIRAFRNL